MLGRLLRPTATPPRSRKLVSTNVTQTGGAPLDPADRPARFAGIDVGGTTIKAVLVDGSGTVLEERRRATPRPGERIAERVTGAAAELIGEFAAAHGPLGGAGVVVPGVVDELAGVGVYSKNLGWHDAPFARLLSEALEIPVGFGHDVRAGGAAEAWLGAARGVRNSLFIAIGTGLSAAAIADGRMVSGDGYAGEIGHADVGHGEPCGCGLRGCLEVVASASGIANRYSARSGRSVGGADEVAALVRAGDPDATVVWGDALDGLAVAVRWSVYLLGTETVVLGGGLAQAPDLLLDPIAERVNEGLSYQRRPHIVAAALGDRAGALGAALLGMGGLSG
jgi:glucokinase